MAQKTLLLVFIHGFKGDDTTFQNFPSHLKALVGHALPELDIQTLVYPQFSTTGELAATVSSFRDWLTNQVIDLEVARGTQSPTVDPGVRVILVGHSMGGIVGAEAVLGIAGEDSIDGTGIQDNEEKDNEQGQNGTNGEVPEPTGDTDMKSVDLGTGNSTLMFPFIQGLLAFDTPYLGISPGVIAHGAEKHWDTGKAWFQSAASLFAAGSVAKGVSDASKDKTQNQPDPTKSEPPAENATSPTTPSEASTTATSDTTQESKGSWAKWSRTAVFASAGAAAAAAVGTTAYLKRNEISSLSTSSYNWVSSHLQFVGCLARGDDLRQRVDSVVKLNQVYGVGFANMYTVLGKGAGDVSTNPEITGQDQVVQGSDRTFCNLPSDKSSLRSLFYGARNDKVGDEVSAHMYMFTPKENPRFYEMGEQARDLVVSWIDQRWAAPKSST